MIVTCPACGAKWTGMKIEHCAACCQTFSSTRAGDKHRVGQGPGRRCLTVEEMRDLKRGGRGPWREANWFTVRVNNHGTRIWRETAAGRRTWGPRSSV